MKKLLTALCLTLALCMLCGAALALVNFAKLMWINQVGFTVSLVVCLTLVATVFTAKATFLVSPS